MPLGPRKKLLHYLEVRKALIEKSLSGLEEYQETSITSDVKYRIGPAGTGQPSVFYPKLDFSVKSFFALGSPIALFHAVRGISELGSNFKLPVTDKFFNIFHPYDPVAYRMESLINKEYANLRPVTIPHHAGRKRMHLGKKHALKKYDCFALNTSCFGGSTGSNNTQVVQFHEIFVAKIMNYM